MAFAKEMISAKNELIKLGHNVLIQEDVEEHAPGRIKEEDKWRKLEIDPLKSYKQKSRIPTTLVVG